MAQRRLFSPDIVASDAFLDMPISTQALYFHLGMYADDDGFVNPKKIMRLIGVSDDDLKVLLTKRFVLKFESGVVVIKHWLIHNTIRKDRYHETKYLEEKSSLIIKENGSYTELATTRQPNGNQMVSEVKLSKVKLSEANTDSEQSSQEISKIIDSFKETNPAYKKWFGNKTQRSACDRLLVQHGLVQTLKVIAILPKTNNTPYMPKITTPLQLEDKWANLEAQLRSKKAESLSKKINIII